MTTEVEFWVDPGCPWCWVTARWMVDEVAPQRDLDITWQPISLLFKNNPAEDSPYYARVAGTHKLLRVMESLRAAGVSSADIQRWYLYCGTKVHSDGERSFDPDKVAGMLEHLGLDPQHADAVENEKWDTPVRAGMDAGLALVGDDLGTPIIAFTADDGVKRGIFGPVLTRVPPPDESLKVWDAMVALTSMDGFWELKRIRTEGPSAPPRLDI
jgi:2-hydroxychromene-2-carboxylate isomerase